MPSSRDTETRHGVAGSALFGAAATASADGAANASYSSFSSFGGGVLMANMMLGEVSPGGAGSGLYGLLVMAMLAVFLGGLMIGRTPQYVRKKLRVHEVKFIALYVLTAPTIILAGAALAAALPTGRGSVGNPGPHGLSEIVYAFTSSANGNGIAFSSLTGNTDFNFAAQRQVAADGSLDTDGPLFVSLVIGVTLLVVGLELFPVLAIGPIAEGLT